MYFNRQHLVYVRGFCALHKLPDGAGVRRNPIEFTKPMMHSLTTLPKPKAYSMCPYRLSTDARAFVPRASFDVCAIVPTILVGGWRSSGAQYIVLSEKFSVKLMLAVASLSLTTRPERF